MKNLPPYTLYRSLYTSYRSLYTAFGIFFLLAILSLPFFLDPYAMNGVSMNPTLVAGDTLVVDTLSLKLFAPRRGEILVFRNPYKAAEGDRIQADVKRVIGLPGETVHVRKDKVVIDRACDESGAAQEPRRIELSEDSACRTEYASGTLLGGGSFGNNANEFDMFLGPQDYFVLGDKRRDSSDSRRFGTVQPENFIGRPIIRILPLSRFTVLLNK